MNPYAPMIALSLALSQPTPPTTFSFEEIRQGHVDAGLGLDVPVRPLMSMPRFIPSPGSSACWDGCLANYTGTGCALAYVQPTMVNGRLVHCGCVFICMPLLKFIQ